MKERERERERKYLKRKKIREKTTVKEEQIK